VNEILSNEEIDTLLQMFKQEGTSASLEVEQKHVPRAFAQHGDDSGSVISAVDLLKPNRLSREQMRGVERYFENAGKLLSATISDRLRIDTRCDCVAVEQQRFQTWFDQLPGPVAIYLLKMEPFRQPVLLTASTSMLYGAVDRILGGSGKVNHVPKDFTAAEYTVADALIGPCLDRVVESLAEVVKLKWSIENRFCNASMAQILPSQDVVLSAYFQTAGEFLIGDIRMVFPFAAIEPYVEKFAKDTVSGQEPGAMRAKVQKTVGPVPLELVAQLGDARICLRQLLELAPGDVVRLDTRVGTPAVMPVMGRPKFRGHIGRVGNRLAMQVADVVEG
jgi:flagellar motor switch protein FliM